MRSVTGTSPIDPPTIYNQPVLRQPDPTFPLAPSEPFEATSGSPVQTPSEVRFFGNLTEAHPLHLLSFSRNNLLLLVNFIEAPLTSHSRLLLRFGGPAQANDLEQWVEERFSAFLKELSRCPKGVKEETFSDLISELSALGVSTKEDQACED
ncbi:hypothetical protein Esti_000614 [Eimeria stiedai]